MFINAPTCLSPIVKLPIKDTSASTTGGIVPPYVECRHALQLSGSSGSLKLMCYIVPSSIKIPLRKSSSVEGAEPNENDVLLPLRTPDTAATLTAPGGAGGAT